MYAMIGPRLSPKSAPNIMWRPLPSTLWAQQRQEACLRTSNPWRSKKIESALHGDGIALQGGEDVLTGARRPGEGGIIERLEVLHINS